MCKPVLLIVKRTLVVLMNIEISSLVPEHQVTMLVIVLSRDSAIRWVAGIKIIVRLSPFDTETSITLTEVANNLGVRFSTLIA